MCTDEVIRREEINELLHQSEDVVGFR